jgi:N-acetylglucosamine-6-sulfatase
MMRRDQYLLSRPRQRGQLALYSLVVVLSLLCYPVPASAEPSSMRPPNILLLLTDDQDLVVGGMAHMPKLERLLKGRGVTFENGFVHTPICCPSRSSILSGRYLHNGGALNNTVEGNCNGNAWQQDAEQATFATVLQSLGYQTSYAGKYLNLYGIPGSPGCQKFSNGTSSPGCRRVPPGWNRWLGLIGNSQYYNYGVVKSINGAPGETIRHAQTYEKDYLPDVAANFTLESIHEFAKTPDKPFLAVTAWPTAHMPFTPAPWSEHEYDGAEAKKTPNYNASWENQQSKHWMMRWLAPIDAATEKWMNSVYQNRTEALMSVDNHIEQFISALQETGAYDNTWIIYTSDNGWQLGQHRLSYDKRQLYENDIRVPFIVTGPGVPANTTTSHIVLNVDIAPTMADMALKGMESSAITQQARDIVDAMDGTSFLTAILETSSARSDVGRLTTEETADWRHDFLISYHGRGYAQCDNFWDCPAPKQGDTDYHMGDWSNNTYHCIRTIVPAGEDSIYCRFLDDEQFVEYYDLATDPWQLINGAASLTVDQRIQYERRLEELRICQGRSCRTKPSGVSSSLRQTLDVEVDSL